MLSQAIGGVLPTAVGVALSPIPVIAVILMLSTPKGRGNGVAFVLGWIVGLVGVNVVVLVAAGGSASDPTSTTSTSINWVQVGIGVLFLALAGREWRSRPKKGEEPKLPKWMATIDDFAPPKAAGLGLVLSAANPKNLALTLAAAAAIAQAGLSGSQSAVTVAVFVVIASITVAGPVLYFLVASKTAAGPLAAMKEFMSAHNAVIMMVVLVVFGAKLLGEGLGALGS